MELLSTLRRGRFPLPQFGAVCVTLGAVACGGGTERLPQAITLGAMGLLLALAPPKRFPEKAFVGLALALLLLACCAWLPAHWLTIPRWRVQAQEFGIVLPGTISPQPALSLEGLMLFSAGLAWFGWIGTQHWDSRSRRASARALSAGIIVLAAAALVAWVSGVRVPGWLDERGFGPFPNRNHTGHVLALGGVLALGCAADAIRRSRWRSRWRGLLWLAGATLILAALAVNNSRGGVLLFLAAMAIWLGIEAWHARSWKILALGASALLAVSAVMLVAGGPIASRFAGGADSQIAFRALIWKDALALIQTSPWCGAGLENFRALFPFYRSASVLQQTVLHPESDWLWLAAEMGWLGVALAAGALVVSLGRALPLAEGTQRMLRSAALAAAIAAALHGMVDVPAHRLGSVLTALFVLALARRDPAPAPESVRVAVLWRVGGIALMAGSVWLALIPADIARAEALLQSGNHSAAEEAALRGISRAPLDWRPYFTRAGARACAGKLLESLADFRRARFLEPHFAGIPIEEGRFWARRAPALALPAWREAIRRVSPPEDAAIFRAILNSAPDDAAFRASLLALAAGRPALQLIWFEMAPPSEARARRAEILPEAELWAPELRAGFHRRAAEIEKPPGRQSERPPERQ